MKWRQMENGSVDDRYIARLAHFAFNARRECGEGHSISRRAMEMVGKGFWPGGAATLEHLGFAEYELVADLNQIRFSGKSKGWSLKNWEKAIREKMNLPAPHCTWCGKTWLAVQGHRCSGLETLAL